MHLCFYVTQRSNPDTELKAKIESFLAERRNKQTALDIPEKDVVKMDLSEN